MLDHNRSSKNWEFKTLLGSGAFGEVALWINWDSNQSVAIKRCNKNPDDLAPDEREKLQTRWKQELDWANEIKIDNVVRGCQHLCEDLVEEQNRTSKLPVIAMEYCDGGNLRSKLQQIENINGLKESDVRQVLGALGNATFYLHDVYKITHRDIKPDNIVIKYDSFGNPIYKLTDMGYGRILDSNTIIGSMVGSRNYFAPEIIESAEYKNSVDFWSIGVVAFEIICGTYPFLQDRSMFEVLKNIREKPKGCIAITETHDGQLRHHMKLLEENRLTQTFKNLMEQWLPLALENDGRKRGYDELQPPKLVFYSRLSDVLDAKVVTVYWLNKCKYISCPVDDSMTMNDFFSALQSNTGVATKDFYIFTPEGHNLRCPLPAETPIMLYDKDFASQNKTMLYLVDLNSDGLEPEPPFIAEGVQLIVPSARNTLQPRLLRQSMMHTLFVHHNEHRRLAECVDGIHAFARHLEHKLMQMKRFVKELIVLINNYNGQAKQYAIIMKTGNQLLTDKNIQLPNNPLDTSELGINIDGLIHIKSYLKTMLHMLRDFLRSSPLATYLDSVTQQVKTFEHFFKSVSNPPQPCDIWHHCDNVLRERQQFIKKSKTQSPNNMSADAVIGMYKEVLAIYQKIQEYKKSWETREDIDTKSRAYMQQFQMLTSHECANLTERMESLDLEMDTDGTEDAMDIPTEKLIKDSQIIREALNSLF